NLVMLRLRCDQARTFREWLTEVRALVGQAQVHGEVPYEQLCEELRKQGVNPPEVRLLFNVSDYATSMHFGGLEVSPRLQHRMATMPWGFNLAFVQLADQECCRVAFDARLYDPRGVANWIGRLLCFVDAVSCSPDVPLAELLPRNSSES